MKRLKFHFYHKISFVLFISGFSLACTCVFLCISSRLGRAGSTLTSQQFSSSRKDMKVQRLRMTEGIHPLMKMTSLHN